MGKPMSEAEFWKLQARMGEDVPRLKAIGYIAVGCCCGEKNCPKWKLVRKLPVDQEIHA